jgi:hypothetical protein
VAPRDRGAEREQHQARRRRADAGEVAALRRVEADMDDMHRAVDQRRDAERHGQRGARTGPHTSEEEDGQCADRHRQQPGDRVLAEPDPGLATDERVVDRVQDAGRGRDGEHALLGSRRSADARCGEHALTFAARRAPDIRDGP